MGSILACIKESCSDGNTSMARSKRKRRPDKVYSAINHKYVQVQPNSNEDEQNSLLEDILQDDIIKQPTLAKTPFYIQGDKCDPKEFGVGPYYLRKEYNKLTQQNKLRRENGLQENNIRWNKAMQKMTGRLTIDKETGLKKGLITEEDVWLRHYALTNSRNFRKMLKMGPPMQYRWSTWKILVDPDKFFVEGLYEKLRDLPSDSDPQIRKDLHRTFPFEDYFSSKRCNKVGQQQLSNILKAISLYFPNTGYMQAMNDIVGLLLLVSGGNELEVFWMFVTLARDPKFLVIGIFDKDFLLNKFYEFIVRDLLKRRLPKVYRHILQETIPIEIWLFKWFIRLFIFAVQSRHVVRVWDYLFQKGAVGMINIALSIIEISKGEILTCRESDSAELFMNVKIGSREKTPNSSNFSSFIKSERLSIATKGLNAIADNITTTITKGLISSDDFDVEEVIKLAEKNSVKASQMEKYLKLYEREMSSELPEPYRSLIRASSNPRNTSLCREAQCGMDHYIMNQKVSEQIIENEVKVVD